MSDAIDTYRHLRDFRRLMRKHFGKPCPECVRRLPRAQPKILTPGGYCKMHRYTDPREQPTQEQIDTMWNNEGGDP